MRRLLYALAAGLLCITAAHAAMIGARRALLLRNQIVVTGNTASRNPTALDDVNRGNTIGRLWLNTSTGVFFQNASNAPAAAVWTNLGTTSGLPVQASGISWTAVFGTKALTSSWLSGHLFDVVRASDSTTQTINAIAGQPDTATLTTFLSGTTGVVSKWYDQSGNACDATQGTAANRPGIRVIGSQISLVGAGVVSQGTSGTGAQISFAACGSINKQATTFVSVVRQLQSLPRPNTSTSNTSWSLGQWDTSGAAGVLFRGTSVGTGTGAISVYDASNTTSTLLGGNGATPEVDFDVLGYVGNASDRLIFQNEFTQFAGSADNANTVTGGQIGATVSGANYGLNTEVYAFMVAGANALTSAQMRTTRMSLYSLFSIPPQYANDNIVMDGDSITAGYQAVFQNQQGYSAATQMQPLLKRPIRVTNLGLSQQNCANVNTAFSTREALYIVSGARNNIYRIANGTNDVGGAGTAATTWTCMQTVIANAKAAGFNRIILDTMISGVGSTDSERVNYNNLIKSNAGSLGYIVSDVGSDANMGCNGCYANATYFTGDQTHPTAAGQAIIAQYDAAAINSILEANVTVTPFLPYTGPGDIVSGAKGWWGLRCYNAAKAGASQAINIRRASDNATTDIGLTSGCDLDVATATTFCAATSCFVTKAYDQTGNGNDKSQATQSQQPQLLLSGCTSGSLPCMKFVGASSQQLTGITTAISQLLTMNGVAIRTGTFTAEGEIIGAYNSGGINFGFNASANTLFSYGGSALTLAGTDSVWHTLTTVFNGGSSTINSDGTSASGAIGANGTNSDLRIGAYSGGNPLTGNIAEAGVWPGALSATQIAQMNSYQHAYWGF